MSGEKITLTDEQVKKLEKMGWSYTQYGPNEMQWVKFTTQDLPNACGRVAVEGDETWSKDLIAVGVVPKGYDFVITDHVQRKILADFHDRVSHDLYATVGTLEACGLGQAEAVTAAVDRLLKQSAIMACAVALTILDRDPDAERWRNVTDMIFAQCAKITKEEYRNKATTTEAPP